MRQKCDPNTASIIFDEAALPRPTTVADTINARNAPISIYEVHLGSWRRGDGNRWLSYRELADTLPRYARDLGFTHIELMPVTSILSTAPGAISPPVFMRRPAALVRPKISRI